MSDLYKISGKVVKVDGLTLSTDSSGNLETIRATDNEAIAGTDTNKALTPASGLALVTNQIDQRLTNALIYRGSWAITTSTTDYSGLNSYRPIKAGDYFRITGTGPAIIDGVEYNPNDSIIFNQACSATTTITTAMIDHQDHTDSSDTVYENATQTLTNKTIDADDNTISDLETDNFKSGVVVTSIGPSSGSGAATNNELPTALAVRSAINAATPSVDNVTIELGGANNDTLQVKDQGISISKISSSALVLKTSESQSNATIPSYEKVSDMISSATPVVDGTTISLNTSSQLQADGLIEKNQSNAVYDWVGTYAEYQAAKQNNQILDSWICFITDDSFVADPNKIVMTDTAQTITGNKTFSGTVQVPTSSADVGTSTEAVNVKYLYDEGYSALRSNTANIDLSNLSSTGKGYIAIKGYDSTATYSLNEVVLTVSNNEVKLYQSLANNNTSILSDTTKWKEVSLGGDSSSRNIGEIVISTVPLVDAGLHLADGALVSGSGSYADFVTHMAGLVSTNPDLFETEANWQSSVSTYGVCGKYVYDSVNNTVRLPKLQGFIEGTLDSTKLGDLTEAGLPNITGSITNFDGVAHVTWSGAFYKISASSAWNESGSSTADNTTLGFDASRSSSIYGNSTTVQPQSTKVFYYVVIATSTKTDIQVDIDEIAFDLNGKADIDFSNVNTPTQTFKDMSVNWGMPDYSRTINISSSVTATSTQLRNYSYALYLFIKVQESNVNGGQIRFECNGTSLDIQGEYYSYSCLTIPVPANTDFKLWCPTVPGGVKIALIVPCKETENV